jgi:stage II sporulation protein AA (anti-sigma F factor antagonist)
MEGKTAPQGAISAFAASGGGLEELMELNAKSVDRKLLLELSGEVDHHGAKDAIRQLELAVDAALPRQLVLDMAGVTFMDSSGIALILRAQQRMQLLDGSLLVCNVPPQARRVLDAAGIGRLVTIR